MGSCFSDQGLNPYPLHWEAETQSLDHQGSPRRSAESLSRVQLFATPWTAACQASLSINNSWSLLKLMSIMLVMPSNYLVLCHPLLLLPSIPPSISFSISPSNEYSGLISFRTDRLDLLAVQGAFKSLLQHHSSKASILQCSGFFMVYLSHPYMTTGKTTALTRQTFAGKIMFLLFNMLSRLVITFLPWSKPPLISWRQPLSTVIWEPSCVSCTFCSHSSIFSLLFFVEQLILKVGKF